MPRTPPAQSRPTSSIPRLVVLFVLLCLAPLAALAVSSVRLASDALRTEVEARVASAAQLSAVAVRGEFDGVANVVESYADRPSLLRSLSASRPKLEELSFQLEGLREARPGIAVAFLARPDGRLLDVSPATKSIIGKDFSFRDWYKGVTATGDTYVSEAFVGQAAGKPIVVAVATMVRGPGGRPLAILAAAYELRSLQGFVNRFADSQSVSLTLTDQRGTVLAQPGVPGAELVSRRGDALVAAALRGEAGVATHGDRLAAYRPIAGLDWTVTASVPEQSAFAAITRLRTSVFGATGLLALVLLAGLALLIRSVRHRRHAEDAAKLATAEADRAHAESDRLAAIVDSSDDAILSMTRDGVITSWNGGAERLYGYAAGDVVGEHIGLLIPPERAGEERNILHHVLAGEPLQHYETRRQRKDGSVVDVALTVSPIRDVEGQVTGASTIARDISERRRTEEEARRAWAKPSARTRPRASSSRA